MKMDIDGLDKLQDGLQKALQKGVDELNKGLDRINNPEVKNSVPSNCPNCNAKINITSDDPTITCEYCGTQFDNTKNKSVVDSVIDFVEKQQQMASDHVDKNSDLAALKAKQAMLKEEAKLERRRRREKKRAIRRIIFLIVLIAFGYYYINNREAVESIILPVVSNFLERL